MREKRGKQVHQESQKDGPSIPERQFPFLIRREPDAQLHNFRPCGAPTVLASVIPLRMKYVIYYAIDVVYRRRMRMNVRR